MNIILNNLGATIKQARIAANLTQEELAERIGISWHWKMNINSPALRCYVNSFLC